MPDSILDIQTLDGITRVIRSGDGRVSISFANGMHRSYPRGQKSDRIWERWRELHARQERV